MTQECRKLSFTSPRPTQRRQDDRIGLIFYSIRVLHVCVGDTPAQIALLDGLGNTFYEAYGYIERKVLRNQIETQNIARSFKINIL